MYFLRDRNTNGLHVLLGSTQVVFPAPSSMLMTHHVVCFLLEAKELSCRSGKVVAPEACGTHRRARRDPIGLAPPMIYEKSPPPLTQSSIRRQPSSEVFGKQSMEHCDTRSVDNLCGSWAGQCPLRVTSYNVCPAFWTSSDFVLLSLSCRPWSPTSH